MYLALGTCYSVFCISLVCSCTPDRPGEVRNMYRLQIKLTKYTENKLCNKLASFTNFEKQNQSQLARSVYLNVCPSRVNPKIVFALLFLLFLELSFIFQLQDKSKSSINFKFSSDVKYFSALFHFYGITAISCSCTCMDNDSKCMYTPLNATRNKQKTLEAQTIYKLKSRDP
jgi:hypothetical protein